MALPKINPVTTSAWQKLTQHFSEIQHAKMMTWFEENPNRAQEFQLLWDAFVIDYSKNRITPKTINLLVDLAEESGLKEAIEAQFNEERINETEHRPVLHTSLRKSEQQRSLQKSRKRMKDFSNAVIDGDWLGYSGKRITTLVNIGIGGSDLGPKMVVSSLQYYRNHLDVHYVSNIDDDETQDLLQKLDPETTLFLIVSKSFTTTETLHNAKKIRKWFLKSAPKRAMNQHFVAVTCAIEEAVKFGIGKKNTFTMSEGVGGRFSLWSPVGLSICCAIGYEHFTQLLTGAKKMDKHFRHTDFSENIPVILGLLSIWYNNFFKTETEAVIPYSSYLGELVPYLQQAVMESNGKNISRSREVVDYQTGNIIWGSIGTNAQHAFFQLLHQGTKLVPCDFIGFKKSLYGNKKNHDLFMANFFAQTEALLRGRSLPEVQSQCSHHGEDQNSIYKTFEGNKPSTTILIDQLTPENLGSLIALYEHKIFVQGIIWNIYSYDQWGVELGKELAKNIHGNLKRKKVNSSFDSSTASLLKHYLS